MKRFDTFVLLLLICLFFVFTGIGRAAEKPNIVKNPGLEIDADADGVPDHWSVPKLSNYPARWRGDGAGVQFGRSTVAHSGKYSVGYSVPSPAFPTVAADDWWDYAAWEKLCRFSSGGHVVAFKTEDFPVNEYHLYRVQCYVKAENVLNLHVKFVATYHYQNQKEPVVRWIQPLLRASDGKTHKNGTWDWEKWEVIVPIPEFVEEGRIEFWLKQLPAPAKLFCDDVSVTDLGPYPFFEKKRKPSKGKQAK